MTTLVNDSAPLQFDVAGETPSRVSLWPWIFLLALSVATVAIVHRHRLQQNILPKVHTPLVSIQRELGSAVVGVHGYQWMSSDIKPSSAELLENGVPLLYPNALHDDIRNLGRGRYSFWHDAVYFSSSDNSDPLTNGRHYEIRWPLPLSKVQAYAIYIPCAILACLSLVMLVRKLPQAYVLRRARVQLRRQAALKNSAVESGASTTQGTLRTYNVVLHGAFALGGIVFTIVVAEAVFRIRERVLTPPTTAVAPKETPSCPTVWDKNLSWLYVPGAEFKFWMWKGEEKEFVTEQKVNAWGFTDKPVPQTFPKNAFKVMVLGDSFLEGLHVNMDQKVGINLEQKLQRESKRPVQVVSLGHSGTGQVAQYAYWKQFAPKVQPHALVMITIANDLRDNHPQLTARYFGWDPISPPRYTVLLSDQGADGLIDIPPKEDWQSYSPEILRAPVANEANRGVLLWSALGRFVSQRLAKKERHDWAFDWNYLYKGTHVDYAFMNKNFFADPYIREGYDITERMMRRFKREADALGVKMYLLIGDVVTLSTSYGGGAEYRTMHDWWTSKAKEMGITYASIPETIAARTLSLNDYQRADGHWSPAGSALAADLISQMVQGQLSGSASASSVR